MVCMACGRRVDPNRSFCTRCGSFSFADDADARPSTWSSSPVPVDAPGLPPQAGTRADSKRRQGKPPRLKPAERAAVPAGTIAGCLGAAVRLAIFAGILWYVTTALMRIPPIRAFADAVKSGDNAQVTAAADDVRSWFQALVSGTPTDTRPTDTPSAVSPDDRDGAPVGEPPSDGRESRAGQVYEPGNGVTMPRPTARVDPAYTAEALRRKIEGSVLLTCIVRPDFSVSDIEVVRSLDPVYGLDGEAVKALGQWRFTPGRRNGRFVPVRITVEMTFTLP